MTTPPASYTSGLQAVDNLTGAETVEWLRAEIRDESHWLAGHLDDQPVQAFRNYLPYFSLSTRRKVEDALGRLIQEWKSSPLEWSFEASFNLLGLTSVLSLSDSKLSIQGVVEDGLIDADARLLLAVLQTLAQLATNSDRPFWTEVAHSRPNYSGLAFQVLLRIAPRQAFEILTVAAASEASFSSVERVLPDYLSTLEGAALRATIEMVEESLAHLPENASQRLAQVLSEEGFELRARTPRASEQVTRFVVDVRRVVEGLRFRAPIPQFLANA